MLTAYVGNAPYCYANSLVMACSHPEITPGLVETLTGSAFGFHLLGGTVPMFDPYGWDPDLGLEQARHALGLRWVRRSHPHADAAMRTLVTAEMPMLVGPLDMGRLGHQPNSRRAEGSGQFVLVLEADDQRVIFHDPQGHPYAALPTALFLTAWRADRIGYSDQPYVARMHVTMPDDVDPVRAVTDTLPMALEWAHGNAIDVPVGTIGGADAYWRLAELLADNAPGVWEMLAAFGIRLAARRRHDAATWLTRAGYERLGAQLDEQARVIGTVQYAAVTRDLIPLVRMCFDLAEHHNEMLKTLERVVWDLSRRPAATSWGS